MNTNQSSTNFDANKIKTNMPVVGSNNAEFGKVDHLEGDSLKLNRDEGGVHHYIPLTWIKTIDDKVHVDRPKEKAVTEWSTKPITT